ncbi:NAD(P)/FAD-dependent oxidoreductase [Arcticibacter tournemirensis]|uniref:NAD(P)/FAD-dependent oxidoreductase n=1 Tax=Arcticibacter tournemirensis TaxID=699437 RepID=A0A4Q0MEE6_9SPHI|nr:NAD(P)/FAD-dependent oxidoreductase [Arcticibacter tournemirensis]RXF71821.1 NAD(P)/FAD-dependent oxidoreductase [Arcticibacter tournemirensis]
MEETQKIALIIGAGPAGLTASYELLTRTNIRPIVIEQSDAIGGISRTVKYKGNRIDIGGHRFFSKSDRVMEWWQKFMPFQSSFDCCESEESIVRKDEVAGPENDRVMLLRRRISRIFFLRKFFEYPLNLTLDTLGNLGVIRIARILVTYVRIRLFPIQDETYLEAFLVNRFGKELYKTFFKSYTEKVWGVPCSEIKSEWGAQRIKGLSISKAIKHAFKTFFAKDDEIGQKNKETSLIDKFLYPKYGPGQLWEEVASNIKTKGGEIIANSKVLKIDWINSETVEVTALNEANNEMIVYKGNLLFSTMPVMELIESMGCVVPDHIKTIARGLKYRDFITVGLLLKKLNIENTSGIKTVNGLTPDNWIYIQEGDVSVGRIQIFNNWSPYMVGDERYAWVGLEYFCNEGDKLWVMEDGDFINFAVGELVKLGMIELGSLMDSTIIRVPKAYPAYFGTYGEFDKVKDYLSSFSNLFLIGRNGMHRYNNQDHSMLTAMVAVDNILDGNLSKENIWAVNAEQEYHEVKGKKY